MSDSKIKFMTYNLLHEYGLLDPYYLDRNIESLRIDDVHDLVDKLGAWYKTNQRIIITRANNSNTLFNIAPKTFFRIPLAHIPIFSISAVFPFLPFANRIFISDPVIDSYYLSIEKEEFKLNIFKENIKKINKEIRLIRPFIDDNLILFYDFHLVLSKYDLSSPKSMFDLSMVKQINSDDFINYLLDIYKKDSSLLPEFEVDFEHKSSNGQILEQRTVNGTIAIEGQKMLLRNYHLPEAFKGVIGRDIFKSHYSSDDRTALVVTKKLLNFVGVENYTAAEDFISKIPNLDIFSEGLLQPPDILYLRRKEDDSVKIFQGALNEFFSKIPEGLLVKDYNRLIKNEVEPQIKKINLEAKRIRSKYNNTTYQDILLSSLCVIGSLFGATLLNQPDLLKVLLGGVPLVGFSSKLLNARINKKSDLEKLKQEDFYLLWRATKK